MKDYIIGIDLGGTKISGAISYKNGDVLDKYTIPTEASKGQEIVFDRITQVIDTLMERNKVKCDMVEALGIGTPGPLDSKKGVIIKSANLPFKNFNIVYELEKKYNIKSYIDNDANVAAIGEYMKGAGKGTQNMIYVTVSTGIGGGAIINGKIYRGNTCNALEVGHMTLKSDGPKCNCGNYGCAEALGSGTAIGKQAMEAIKNGEETSLKNYDKVTAFEVFQEAKKNDKIANEILDNSLNYLGICVANLITIFDPEMVVIGGGVSKGGQVVFNKVQEVVDKRCFKVMRDNCRIVPAKLGTDAGVIGALCLALMESGGN